MDRGRLMQVAPPTAIYEQPNSRWVADFIGDVNLFEGRMGADGLSVEGTAAGHLRVAVKADAAPGVTVWVAVRPEKARITREPPLPGADNCVAGTIVDIGYLGDTSIYKLRLRDGAVMKVAVANVGGGAERALTFGEEVWLIWPPENGMLLTQ
jgi:putrescine transport system ATP-binding protein